MSHELNGEIGTAWRSLQTENSILEQLYFEGKTRLSREEIHHKQDGLKKIIQLSKATNEILNRFSKIALTAEEEKSRSGSASL